MLTITDMKMKVSVNKSQFYRIIMPRSFLVKSKKSHNVHRPIDTEQTEQKLPDPTPKTSKCHYFSITEFILKCSIVFIFIIV